jgi:hypothetical protein
LGVYSGQLTVIRFRVKDGVSRFFFFFDRGTVLLSQKKLLHLKWICVVMY